MTPAVIETVCRSEAALAGYVGAISDSRQGLGTQPALIPDGVGAILYALADGRRFTVPVRANLALPPAALSLHAALPHPTAAQLSRLLAAHLPTAVTEIGTGHNPTVTLARPVSLIPDAVETFSFLRRLLRSSFAVSTSGSGSFSMGASCSAGRTGVWR